MHCAGSTHSALEAHRDCRGWGHATGNVGAEDAPRGELQRSELDSELVLKELTI